MKYVRITAGYSRADYKTNTQIGKELKITPILEKILEYKSNWTQHVNGMPRNRLSRVMKHYSPTGRRNHGRTFKRLRDTWDRNGSTSGPTAWQICDDDDYDDYIQYLCEYKPIVMSVQTKWDTVQWKWSLLYLVWFGSASFGTPVEVVSSITVLKSGNASYCSVQVSKNIKIEIHRTIILSVVLYGCETWSHTMREEHRLRVFENWVLRIFGPKRDEVTGEWRKIHKEELNDLYCSPNIIRENETWRITRAGHFARMGTGEVQVGFWFGDPKERDNLEDAGLDGRIIFKRLFKKWDEGLHKNDLVYNRDSWRALVNVVLNIRVP